MNNTRIGTNGQLNHLLTEFECMLACILAFTLTMIVTETRAQSVYTPYAFTNFVGMPAGVGSTDGIGSAAQFSHPSGVGVDNAGNVYVTDTDNSTIRKISSAGEVTTLAGSAGQQGSANGIGSTARFLNPIGVAVDNATNVYVADVGNSTIRKITPDGAVTTLAGSPGQAGSADGIGSAAQFYHPNGLAVDNAGNVYVTDSGNDTIRKITPAGVVTTLAGRAGQSGIEDGIGIAAEFNFPQGIAVDSAGNVYVGDTENFTIRKITPVGAVTTLAGSAGQFGSEDGTSGDARFYYPEGVAVDSAGNVYVADSENATIRKITPAGEVTTLAGNAGWDGSDDGIGSDARFNGPEGVAVDSVGNLFVADTFNYTIRKITSDRAVTTLAGTSGYGSADGTGSAARFWSAIGVTVDRAGNVYVADYGNHTIRKITRDGAVTTLAGSAGQFGSVDGTGNAARFYGPTSVAVDSVGNVYVADTFNYTIRKITPAGDVTTLAGSAGQWGSDDGIGSDARFSNSQGVAVGSAGNVYVADLSNHTIRKIAPDGVVTTLAGSAGQWGTTDGIGADARFNRPISVAVDSAENVYVTDGANYAIRKVTPIGAVTTLAGGAGQFGNTDGTGSAARFADPYGLAVDSAGNVYVADWGANTIRKVTPAGVVTTLAGSASQWGSDDGVGSAARFNHPGGVAVDSLGSLYVTDTFNNRITKGTPVAPRLISPIVDPGGEFRFTLLDEAGCNYTIEASTDLVTWLALTNFVSTTGSNQFTDPDAANLSQRFYRAVQGGAVSSPTLISPESGASGDNGRTDISDYIIWDFDWSDVLGASQYQLFVKGLDALNPVIDVTTTNSFFHYAQYGSYILGQYLNGWTWKVRARVGGVWGDWSEIRSFDVEPMDTDPPIPP